METMDRIKIKENLDKLASLIDMEILMPKLIEHEIFFENYPESSKWQNNLKSQRVIKSILTEIQTRGPHAFQNLIRSLEETNQVNCAQILARITLEYVPSNAVRPLKIKVEKSTSFYDDLNNFDHKNPFEAYTMKNKPRGIVLIMSLYNDNDNETSQKSAENDEKNLKDLFNQMGFKVIIEKNLDIPGIKQKAKEFSKNSELRFVDCAFFIVIGNNVQDTNYVSMSLKNTRWKEDFESTDNIAYGELIHYFNGQNCPNLLNKPKIFIFHVNSSVHINNNIVTTVNGDDDIVHELNLRDISKTKATRKLRNYSDMLISFSIMYDNTYGITKNGSLFYQVLCEVFMKYAHNTHVQDLFKVINERSKSLRPDSQNVPYFLINIGFQRCFLNPGMFS